MPSWLLRRILSAAAPAIGSSTWLTGKASWAVVKYAVEATRTRPHPFSTLTPYTSWRSLTDRTFSARHLPPADAPVQPAPDKVMALFARPAGQQLLSDKSTCLFPAFAQYLTDGFIRTDPGDPRKTTTNHDIDLCPLYGRTILQTRALRLKSEDAGKRGRLKSQTTPDGEYPPFLYTDDSGTAYSDPAFADLDPPLFTHGQPITPPGSPVLTPSPRDVKPEAVSSLFAVGGDRVNSTPFTAMMNTLLLREHNRIAGELETRNPGWGDEQVFQTARNILIPIFIKIVIEQYINHIMPIPFGIVADPSLAWNAAWNKPNWITAEFSLLYRWHSLMPDTIAWPDGQNVALKDFTLDNRPLLKVGLGAAFQAAAAQKAGALGAFNTAESLLMVETASVMQARFNRIATYNAYREAFGSKKATSFADISTNPAVAAKLEELYGTPDNVEFYPGLFSEDRVPGSPLPDLIMTMVAVDAFSQALTNPLLSEHVWNSGTFTQWGFGLIANTHSLSDLLVRTGSAPAGTKAEMTQADWRYP